MAESKMKSLAKDTAIYGLSSIVGRFLNYLLVPIYTRVFLEGEYGIVTNIYAYVALVFVILTYGMETTFFRYVNKEDNPTKVYSTTLISIATTSLIFVAACFIFLNPISTQLGYSGHTDYIAMFAIIVALDAFTSIPFAYLRYKKRPAKFASIKISMILLNIVLNIFFIVICPRIHESNGDLISWFYNPNYGIGYIFLTNLLTSAITLFMLLPFFTGFKYQFDWGLLKRMLKYTMPLLVLAIAGVLNQAVDKIIYPFLIDNVEVGNAQLGIYGACAKIAVVMTMFTQAFRYAYEPFIFSNNKADREDDKKQSYAAAMKYFIIFGLFAFLIVMFYLDIFQYIVDVRYREGLTVVPILMMSEIFFGIYFNLSLWYKLTDKTHYGAIFSLIGTVVIISINVIFVPTYGYMASAWASFIGNLLMMVISYAFGQKYFPIHYSLRTIGFYFLLATGLYLLAITINIDNEYLRILYRTVLLSIFVAIMVKRDLPLSQLPIIGKWIRKK